jgi:Holliday junction resolvase RusA-like endonuclease
MSELRLVVPMIPPSGNHYKTYRIATPRGGKSFVQWYPTPEAEAWWGAVQIINAGRAVRGQSLEISYIVFLPTGRASDVDNYAKCIFDALTKCGAIEDDRYVTDFHGHRRVDLNNPRTVIVVKSDQEQLEGFL